MRFQLVVDFDAESSLEAELVASLCMAHFRQYAKETGEGSWTAART